MSGYQQVVEEHKNYTIYLRVGDCSGSSKPKRENEARALGCLLLAEELEDPIGT